MAGRDYEVGETVYEFPDSYSDDQVKSILTKKGVIKVDQTKTLPMPEPRKSLLQSGAESAYEAKYGMPAPANLGTGGLGGIMRAEVAAPSAIMAPVSTAVGMGTGEAVSRGARALGAGETASDIAGTIAGVGAGAATGMPRVLGRKLVQAVSKVPTGGVASDIAGVISPRVAHGISLINRARKIFKMLPEEPTPFPPGKGTGAPYKYPGPAEPEYGQPGVRIPRRDTKLTPATTPYPPGKGTGAPYKYPGPSEPEYGPSYRGTPKRAAGSRAASPESPSATPEPPTLETQLQKSIELKRGEKAYKLAELLRVSKISKDLAERATPAQRNEMARQIGMKSVSEDTWKQVLRKLGSRSATPPLPPSRFGQE